VSDAKATVAGSNPGQDSRLAAVRCAFATRGACSQRAVPPYSANDHASNFNHSKRSSQLAA
jgi:hypothetical protein